MVAEAEEFDPSIVADADDAALMAAISKRDAEVQPLIKSHPIKALQLALADPPYATNTVAVKEASFDVVCKPIMTIKEADIEVRSRTQVCVSLFAVACCCGLFAVACSLWLPSRFPSRANTIHTPRQATVGALTLDECDVLMKYLYRGLGQPHRDKQYTVLLRWHPLVLKRAGEASIVRAISEVRRAL